MPPSRWLRRRWKHLETRAVYGPRPSVTTRRISIPLTSRTTMPFSWTAQLRVFLDDPDPSVTAARRAAFLNFVRGGKGVAGIHAATDSYHTDCVASEAAATSGSPGLNTAALVLAARLVKAAD